MKKTSSMLMIFMTVSSIAIADTIEANEDSESLVCSIAGKRFHVGDLVRVDQPSSSLHGVIAYVTEDDPEEIEQHRRSNNCPGHCVVYSLITLHDQQRFACCQPYLLPAHIK